MSVKAINQTTGAGKRNNLNEQKSGQQQTFTGSFNPVVTVMDAIDRGGYMASFIAQDTIGMAAPRISEGLNRNRPKDENGKKTGPLNWEFARREGIREILSGPSAYLIPLGILSLFKKASGTANNVHVNHIETLGEHFAEYASKNSSQINNVKEFKRGYYIGEFENALKNSTDNKLSSNEIKQKAKSFADKLIDIETNRANKNKKGAKKLQKQVVEEYMQLRKSTVAASSNDLGMTLSGSKKLNTSIKQFMQSLTDYSNDAIDKTTKYLKTKSAENIKDFITKFNKHRAGTRVLANFGMWGSVVGFYALIPKIYNIGLKHDPGLNGLVNEHKENDNKNGKDVSFTGNWASKIGETAAKQGNLNKLLGKFEFNDASMSVPAMLTLLFGFTLPARYLNAKSDKERKEILVRDIASFAAILFAAKALSRGFSTAFAKISGLALNTKPADHAKSLLHKAKNYLTAGDGINVLNSEQIVSKYSKLDGYKDGINGFFKFIEENGGDIKKVLKIDKCVKRNSEKIIQKYYNKPISEASMEEIHNAFKKAKNSKELEKIYTEFEKADNKFVSRAKTYNSLFGFASTIVLVPAFMIWLARYCERMTKKAVAKEMEQKKQTEQPVKTPTIIATSKPTMAGFLNNS